ncbi:MAG: hypothetical protein R2867_00250 [Caldilineaceae bacterium]
MRQATDRLLQRQELLQPIRDAMQLIEEDADTLLDTLDILQNGELQQNQSRQDIVRTGASRLQLSGAFAVEGTWL